MAIQRQIIALGGGGFSMEPDNLLLDDYVLRASGKTSPRVCFFGTASYDASSYIERFLKYIGQLTPHTSHISLWKEKATPAPDRRDLNAHLMEQDVIYVGGGNTMNMVKLWREMGVDKLIRAAYERGVVLAGISAGSICWFEEALTDSIPGKLTPMPFLGFLPGSNCVHYDGEAERRPSYMAAIASGAMKPGVACDDGAAAHYIDGRFAKVVCSRPLARAFQVGLNGETPLSPEYLGTPEFKHRLPVIRRAVIADGAGILAAHRESVREIASKDYSPEQVAAWIARGMPAEEVLSDLMWQIANEWIWVVEVEGVVEGYMHLRAATEGAPTNAYLHGLYLTPAVAGRGLGRRLMTLAEDEARTHKFDRMSLHASKSARQFYERLGFKDIGAEVNHVVDGVELPCFPMGRLL